MVIENSIKKEIIANDPQSKKYNISKRSVKFSEFSTALEQKKIKLPLYYKSFVNYKELKKYLNMLEKKSSLPVLIKANSLVFKNVNQVHLYSLNHEEIVGKIKSLNINFVKLLLVLKHLKKKLS